MNQAAELENVTTIVLKKINTFDFFLEINDKVVLTLLNTRA